MASNSLVFKIGADMKQFRTAMDNASKSIAKVGKKMQKTGKSMTTYMSAPLTALGGAAVATFSTFEQEMAKVNAISGATETQFKALSESAKDLGASTRFTASEVAQLQLNYSKLGFAPEEINKVTGATLNLALATGEDLAQSATVAASTLRGFGLDASEMGGVVDVMAMSFSSSALDLEKFSTAMGALAPVAKGAGVGIEEATSFLSILVDRGVDASTAGIGLRNMFLDLASSGMSLEDALSRINNSSNKNATAMALFGKRGATVASIMADNISEARGLEQQYLNSSGAAQRMADIMDNTLQGSLLKLQSATEAMGIEFGEILAPTVNKLAGLLASLAGWFTDLSDNAKKWIVIVGGVVAAIGPFLLTLGTIMQMAPLITAALGGIAAAFNAINWPIVAIVAAIASFVAAGIYMWDNWEAITQNMTKAWVATKNFLLDGIIAIVKGITWFSRTVLEALGFDALSDGVDFIVEKLESLKDPLPEVTAEFGSFGDAVSNAMDKVFPSIKGVSEQVEKVGSKVETTTKKIEGIGSSGRAAIEPLTEMTENTSASFTKLDEGANTVTESIGGMGKVGLIFNQSFQEGLDATIEKVRTVTQVAQQLFGQLFSVVSQMMDNKSVKEENELKKSIARVNKLKRTDVITSKEAEERIIELKKVSAMRQADIKRKQFKTEKAMGIATAIIHGALAVTQALSSLPPPASYAVAAASAGLAAAQVAVIASKPMPAFADGGLVFGPTMGLVGEGIGTTRSNPEVIAPLDKLKNFIQGDNKGVTNNLTVTGMIRGEDIYLSNRNSQLAYANLIG